jgi:hypothetical protein
MADLAASLDQSARDEGWLTANIKAPKVNCTVNVPWFVATPHSGLQLATEVELNA